MRLFEMLEIKCLKAVFIFNFLRHVLLIIYYVVIQKKMSPRKSEEDVMNKFCKSKEGQKQSFTDVLQDRCS